MKTPQEIAHELRKGHDLCKGHEFIDYSNGTRQCVHCGLSENTPLTPTVKTKDAAARTDVEPYDLTQIPLEAEKRIGAVFREGEVKYGRDNWRLGADNTPFQIERANHALKHLKIYIHLLTTGEYVGECRNGEPEDDLAKVAWFCCTQMEIERLESKEVCYEPTK
jgi:hypothetical protein